MGTTVSFNRPDGKAVSGYLAEPAHPAGGVTDALRCYPLRLKRLMPAAKSARNLPHRSSIPDTGHFAPARMGNAV
jgi:hypothetical protein